MKKVNQTWLENLIKEGVLEDFDTSFGAYYRFVSSNFHISADKLSFLKKEYQPGLEKGGYFLVAPEKNNNSVLFVVKEIHFLTNHSPTPWKSYRRDLGEKEKLISYSLDKKLLPISFHSHPTESVNLLLEAIHFNQQMDTSHLDKLVSLFSRIPIKNSKLRLPEILVVCNGSLKGGIFIGFYGGLISPLDFSERQKVLKTNFSDKVADSVESFLDSPGKKGLGLLTASALIFLTLKYPKSTLTTLATLAATVPSIAYTSSRNNDYFGISHNMSLQISLPNIDNESIIRDEKYLLDLYEQWKKGEFNKAA